MKTSPVPIFDPVPPGALALIGSMRATGYDIETAVADIIDNSITAGAKKVQIIICDEGKHSWFAFVDDGQGMDEPTLIRAMTFGGINPSAPRAPEDLGRFGLGLKTASLSQCRRLTVLTKTQPGKVLVRCWDIDVIEKTKEWALLRKAQTSKLEDRFRKQLESQKNGTVVIWELLDRLGHEDGDQEIANRLRQVVPLLEQHLAMVFHRFLEDPSGLRLFLGDEPITPWNPFLKGEKALQELGEETLEHEGYPITVRPFVLPHVSKLTGEAYRQGAGPNGWAAQQGFYVYRNRRLLVAGSWLKLGFAKEEHQKLARIQLDFPNTLDFAWDINVRKSRAVPPHALRAELKRIAKKTRSVATAIYRHRGASIGREYNHKVFLWQKKVKHNKVFYELNRDHPAVATLLSKASAHGIQAEVASFLRMVEDTIPVPLILIDGSEQPDSIGDPAPKKAPPEIRQYFGALYAALCETGQAPSEAFERLATAEPFHRYPEMLAAFKEKKNAGDQAWPTKISC